jgi:hypothetical protein
VTAPSHGTDDWVVPEDPQRSLFENLKEAIVGRHDPAYAGVHTVFEQFPDELTHPTASAAMLGASDPQMADIIQKHLGDKFIRREKDANGYDVMVTRAPEGGEQKGYVNAPGLDAQDMWRAFYGAAPYVVTGLGAGAIARKLGAGRIASPLLQALGAGTASVAGDIGQIPLGSEQGIEPGKATSMTLLGGLGELGANAGAALWRRFVTEPRYLDRATGQLTELGKAAAAKLGLDPDSMASETQKVFAKTYAATPQDAERVLRSHSATEFNIPSTVGQRLKDPEQLLKEKAMRTGLYGAQAKDIITGLDEEQRAAIERGVHSTIPETLRGAPIYQLPSPADLGERIVRHRFRKDCRQGHGEGGLAGDGEHHPDGRVHGAIAGCCAHPPAGSPL